MKVLDCRFSCIYPARNTDRKFPSTLLERNKSYSGSRLIQQSPVIGYAGWKLKQLAREQLRQPEVMGFIGSCFSKLPQEYGMLLAAPDVKALSSLIAEANGLRPENKAAIISQAGIAIELMKIRNRLLFEGPRSAFAYFDSAPEAEKLHASLGKELHDIRMGLHVRRHFIFHPKTVELHDVLKHNVLGKCLILCESRQQTEVLANIFHGSTNAYFSNSPAVVSLRNYSHLVLYSTTSRLAGAICLFRGHNVSLLAMEGTWEEGAYRHYTGLEKSRPARQGSLGLDVPYDRP